MLLIFLEAIAEPATIVGASAANVLTAIIDNFSLDCGTSANKVDDFVDEHLPAMFRSIQVDEMRSIRKQDNSYSRSMHEVLPQLLTIGSARPENAF